MKKKVQLTTTIRDLQHFNGYYNDQNRRLLIIDVHPAWSGHCKALEPCYKSLQSGLDDFEKRADIILVDAQKLEELKNPTFECTTTKPKILLALEGKIVHEIHGPNVSELEDNVKKFIPYN